MGRLLTFVVAAFAFVALTFGLATAQIATPGADVVTNELGTPCASLPATPGATPMATPEATPVASPETTIMGGCETRELTPVA